MPLKAKQRLHVPKRRRTIRASSAEGLADPDEAVPDVAKVDEDQEDTEGRMSALARLELFAVLAWSSDYMPVLKMEAKENGAVDAVPEHLSSYRHRQLQKSASCDATFWKSALRISVDYERLKREHNMHYIAFSQACASHVIVHLNTNKDVRMHVTQYHWYV